MCHCRSSNCNRYIICVWEGGGWKEGRTGEMLIAGRLLVWEQSLWDICTYLWIMLWNWIYIYINLEEETYSHLSGIIVILITKIFTILPILYNSKYLFLKCEINIFDFKKMKLWWPHLLPSPVISSFLLSIFSRIHVNLLRLPHMSLCSHSLALCGFAPFYAVSLHLSSSSLIFQLCFICHITYPLSFSFYNCISVLWKLNLVHFQICLFYSVLYFSHAFYSIFYVFNHIKIILYLWDFYLLSLIIGG